MLVEIKQKFLKVQSYKTGSIGTFFLGIGMFILIIIVYFYFTKIDNVNLVDTPPVKQKTFGDLVQVISPSEIPGNLPKDLPFEKDVPLLKNELVYFVNTGEIHSVRSYYSQRSMDKIFPDFKKYFESNKWEAISSVDEENIKFLLGRKKEVNGILQINISKNQIDGRVLVEAIKIDKNSTTVTNN